jgi:hypothetical protein
MVADIAACTIALLQSIMSIYRMLDAAPGKFITSIHMGPQHWLFNLGFLAVTYLTSALLPFLAMALRTSPTVAGSALADDIRSRSSETSGESFYTRHRHALCLLNRLLRLVYSTAHLLLPGGTKYIAHAIAARTQGIQPRPMKALLVNVLHPTAFWMTQVRCCCCCLSCKGVPLALLLLHACMYIPYNTLFYIILVG